MDLLPLDSQPIRLANFLDRMLREVNEANIIDDTEVPEDRLYGMVKNWTRHFIRGDRLLRQSSEEKRMLCRRLYEDQQELGSWPAHEIVETTIDGVRVAVPAYFTMMNEVRSRMHKDE